MDDQPETNILPSKVHCRVCGYDLTGTVIGGVCPECGTSVASTLRPVVTKPNAANATASLVCGALSLSCCPLIGIVAIILGAVALNEIKSGDHSDSSRTMALIGLSLGCISTVLGGGFLLLDFIF